MIQNSTGVCSPSTIAICIAIVLGALGKFAINLAKAYETKKNADKP
jgi:hypothetical protein